MKKLLFTLFFACCSVTAFSQVYTAPVVVQPSAFIFTQPQPQIVVPLEKPAVKHIQYFLIPHVIEVNRPVIKTGLFGRLYIVNEKTLETYNVWQPVEVWK
jgi:hypothetical protein